jgi:transcriptional regulator with XRE-family HTH domain
MEIGFQLCDNEHMLNIKTGGAFIRHHRTKAGMTQQELADAIGMTNRSVSQWETNRETPSRDALAKLAAVFRIKLDEFKRFWNMDVLDVVSGWQSDMDALSPDEQENLRRQARQLTDALLADPQRLDQWLEYGKWLRQRGQDASGESQ